MGAVAPAAAREAGFGTRFVTPLYLGSALNPVNSSLIATALVSISHGVGVSVGRTTILVSALYLASAVAQPTAGKLAEVFGPRRVFVSGILLVLAGGVLGGAAHSLALLTVARVLIGLGTSGAYPSAMLMIRRRAQQAGLEEPPGRVLGGLQLAGTATAALGLPVGGVLVGAFGWRSTFLVNVPVTLVALAFALAWLPRDAPVQRPLGVRSVLTRTDLVGIVLFAATMVALLAFLNGLPGGEPALLAVAAVAAVVFVLRERAAREPFLDLRLLARNLALTRTYVRFGLTSLCVYTVLYGLSSWLEAAHGFSAQTVGLLVLPMTGISALVIGPVARRNLTRSALVVSALASVAGSLLILVLHASTPVALVVLVTLVFGVALGAFAPANQTALYRRAEAAQIGTAAGLLRTFGYVGSIASSALIAIAFHDGVTDSGLHSVAAIMVGVSVVGVLLAALDRGLGAAERRA